MNMKTALAASAAACLGLAGSAQAASISLFNTGVDASGVPQANGSPELHYTLISAPGGAASGIRVATSANGFPIGPWLGDNSVSAWDGPNSDGSLNGPGGQYDYRLTFSLAGLNPATAVINGQWAADDHGDNILINGVGTGQTTASAFSAFTPFSVSSGFQSGTNTLDFLFTNSGGPLGLRVEMTGTAVPSGAPEPASWALMLLGVGVSGAFLRQRRQVAALSA